MQQLLRILESENDVSSCLANCSNQGVCKLANQTQKYFCQCISDLMKGSSCQLGARPCSKSNKCLNNGTCVDSLDLTSYSCQCPQNGVFYGRYCENRRNLCKNITCSLHGYCKQSQNTSAITQCKCHYGYNGDNCEIELIKIKIVKNVQWSATAICIAVILTFWTLVICSDILDYFKIGHYHIDMKEWRFEKFHGYKRKPPIDHKKIRQREQVKQTQNASGASKKVGSKCSDGLKENITKKRVHFNE